jgi:hypothetical protein
MAAGSDNIESWLSLKLKTLNMDEGVLLHYNRLLRRRRNT